MAEATTAAGREQKLAAKLREQLSAANNDAARQVCCVGFSSARGHGMESHVCDVSVAVCLAVLLVPPLSTYDSRLEVPSA